MTVVWGHNRGNLLHVLIKGTYLKDHRLKDQWTQTAPIYLKVSRHSTKSVLVIVPGGSE
jgi:hypothetical protein